MQDIHNSSLFTEITPEDEVTVQGGAVPAALLAAVGTATISQIAGAAKDAWWWSFGNGNGLIIGDNKGSWSDSFRWGKGISGDKDLPNGWKWGIKDNGQWVAGGYFNKFRW